MLVIAESSNLRILLTRRPFLGFVVIMEGAASIGVDLISHGMSLLPYGKVQSDLSVDFCFGRCHPCG